MLGVLSNRTYRNLFAAQVVALVGTGLATVALGLLDTDSAALVMGILTSLANDGRAVIVVTHDDGVAARADRLIRLSDGMIVEDTAKAAVQ